MEMIKAVGVTKCFDGFKALDDLSLNVKKGSVYGLVGPNGAGKTTFIKALMGIYRADKGEMTLEGEKIYENETVKRRMVYVSDDLFFFPTYTIKQTAKMYKDIYPNWSDELFEKLHDIYKINLNRKVIRL